MAKDPRSYDEPLTSLEDNDMVGIGRIHGVMVAATVVAIVATIAPCICRPRLYTVNQFSIINQLKETDKNEW